jgi:ABC-type glutathione transport system ATPase component
MTTVFPGATRPTVIVDDASLSVRRGGTLAVVGESGASKTKTFLSALGLVLRPGRIARGQVLLDGIDLMRLSPEELRYRRGPRSRWSSRIS